MIVAYDLRYADGHFTGVGTHAFLLLQALLEVDDDTRYVVLWNTPRKPRYDVTPIASHPRVEWVERPIRTMHPLEPFQLGAWLRERRPDVFFSPFYWKPLGAPCPCVLTIHDLWPLRLPQDQDALRRLALALIVRVSATARLIVTSSEFSRREIAELMHLPLERIRVARLGVAPRTSRVPRRPAALPEGRFALVVGDNRPRKNLELLSRVWRSFGDTPPLRLVGVGPANPRFPSLGGLASAGGARDVSDLGWVPEDELDWLYANAELVLYPTLYEGFGLPLTEAFARGVPAIASDIPVLHEIGDGAVRFAAASNVDAWRAAILQLAGSAEDRAALRVAGLSRAGELTYRRTAEATLDFIREAARSRATR